MSVIVAGSFRVPPENLGRFRPVMATVIGATRQEDGCIVYTFAEDVGEPGLVRIFEIWRDQAALDAHGRSPHIATWRAALPEFGLSDLSLSIYEVATERKF